MLDKELIGELHNIQNIIVQAHNGKIKELQNTQDMIAHAHREEIQELHLIVKELREIIDLQAASIKMQRGY
jgi:hypothetical protein